MVKGVVMVENFEAFGTLGGDNADPATVLMLNARAELRRECEAVRAEEMLAAHLMDGASPVAMSTGALAAVLARIDAADPLEGDEGVFAAFPPSLREPAGAAYRAGRGWRSLSPNIRALDLDLGGASKARILRLPPGVKTPEHSHQAAEYTLVLTGAFNDGHDRYGSGDVCIASSETTHRPVAEAGEICYALSVEEGGLEFKGALGFLQRALRAFH